MSSKKELSSPNLSPLAAAIALAVGAPVANAATFTVTNNGDTGGGSLSQAVAAANANPGEDMVVFDSSVNGNLVLNGSLTVYDDLIIDGSGGGLNLKVQTSEENYIQVIGSSLSINNLSITTTEESEGTMIYAYSSMLSVNGSDLDGFYAETEMDNDSDARGIFAINSHVTVTNTTFTNLYYEGAGAAIVSNTAPGMESSLTVSGSSFTEGYSGIDVDNDRGQVDVSISGSVFKDIGTNGASVIEVETTRTSTNLSIEDSLFDSNYGYAGAVLDVYTDEGGTTGVAISNSWFTYNEAYDSGGVVRLATAENGGNNNLDIDTSVFYGNTSEGNGGVIYATQDVGGESVITVSDSVFDSNNAGSGTGGYDGSAIFVASMNEDADNEELSHPTITANVMSSTFVGNYASDYGTIAGYADDYSTVNVNIHNSTITDNTSEDGAAAIRINSDAYGDFHLKVVNSTIAANYAYDGSEAAVYAYDNNAGPHEGVASSVTIANSVIASNTQENIGYDIYIEQDSNIDVTIVNSLIEAPFTGGGDGNANFTDALTNPDNNNLFFVSPMLGRLSDNGGPTPTMAPLPGSPLLDAGSDEWSMDLASDQRGYARRIGTVDIGAVEGAATPGVISTESMTEEDGPIIGNTDGGPFGGLTYFLGLLGLAGLIRRKR